MYVPSSKPFVPSSPQTWSRVSETARRARRFATATPSHGPIYGALEVEDLDGEEYVGAMVLATEDKGKGRAGQGEKIPLGP